MRSQSVRRADPGAIPTGPVRKALPAKHKQQGGRTPAVFLPGAPDSSVSLARAMRPRQSELIGQDADRDEAALLVWERKIDKMREIFATRQRMAKMKYQDLLKGLIRLHILHHASKEPFYGQWMIHELARHGYTLSPGTLYPMLHGLERRGYLKSKNERFGRTFRRVYSATALGREANKICKIQVRELIGELQRSRAPVEKGGKTAKLSNSKSSVSPPDPLK